VAVPDQGQQPQQPPQSSSVQQILKAAAAGQAAKVAVGVAAIPAVTVTLPAQAAVAAAKVPVGIAVTGLKIAVALRILRALFRRHHADSADWLTKQLRSRYPNADPAVIREAVAREMQYERLFQQKALARVQDDLNAAGQLPDSKQQARINAIISREQHYSKLRQQAMMARATAHVENALVKARSPLGAKWMLGDRKNHTRGCLALAGKAWPWGVLDAIPPPIHTGCGCWLKPLGPGDTVPEPAQAARDARAALALEEAIRVVADPGEVEQWLSGLEVRPSVARALAQLQGIQESVWTELQHPRGRGGEWIDKLGTAHVIAIDGPAASGKSTVARRLAQRLGGTYVDTGAHYRAAGLAKTMGIDPVRALRAGRIRADGSTVTLDGRDISQQIRNTNVDRAASALGGETEVRSAVDSAIHQRIAEGGLFVADGRDAGSALNAHDRIFLTADPHVRAQRRAESRGLTVPQAHAAITERDQLDAPRIDAARSGATHIVDSSQQTPEQTVQAISHLLNPPPSPPPTRRTPTRLAGSYAEAAQMAASGYADRAQRDLETGLAQLPDFLANAKANDQLDMGTVDVFVSMWDTGELRATVNSKLLEYPERIGKGAFLSDPNAVETITNSAQDLTDKFRATTLASQRKNYRGAVAADTGEDGKRAYRAVRAANAANDALPRFAALRDRWPAVEDNQILISEKGYGRAPGGVRDVFVTASRNVPQNLTSINAPAMSVGQRLADEFPDRYGPKPSKPGDQFTSTNDPAGVLRHEWGHGLWEALSDTQRQQFIDMLPKHNGEIDWSAVAKGLSQYAAGNPDYEGAAQRRATGPYSNIAGGYATETFAEAASLVTGPYYKAVEWPGWVRQIGDWMNGVKPE
jgi:cytidylate kinase